MHLIIILLTTVSVLTFLSGLIVFFGSSKGNRTRSAWFLLAAIFATVWMTSISYFLAAQPSWFESIDWHVKWTFVSAIVIDMAFLGYVSWQEKYGYALTAVFVFLGLIVSTLIFINPELLYSAVILDKSGNSVVMKMDILYYAYIGYFSLIVPAIIVTLLKQFVKTKSDHKRGSDLTIMVSFGLSSTLVLIANLILPLFNNWHLIWLGPLALSMTIIAFYYTILKYRALNLSSIWLKVFSYIVLIASLAITYMVIFALVFTALFKGSMPSTEVIILNFIMISIFLVLMPAMNKMTTFVRMLIDGNNTIKKREEKK